MSMGGSFVNHFQFRGRSITRLSLVPAPQYTDAMSDTATLGGRKLARS